MEVKDTLKFIADRYKLDLNQPSPISINQSRWHDLGHLLNDLGCKKAVELGVYKGVFTQALARRAPNMELIGIDSWEPYAGYLDYPGNNLQEVGYPQAHIRAARYPNVKLIQGWSIDVAKTIEDNSLDYIFIDANHAFEFVVEDLKAWVPKVKEGGIVMGHDYFDSSQRRKMIHLNFGVIPAVNGWVESYHIKHLFIWKDQCPSWMFVRGDTK